MSFAENKYDSSDDDIDNEIDFLPISGVRTVQTTLTTDPVLNKFMSDLFQKQAWYLTKFRTFGLVASMTTYLKSLNAEQWFSLRNYVQEDPYQGFVDKLKKKYGSA